jgi:hypothetical protein
VAAKWKKDPEFIDVASMKVMGVVVVIVTLAVAKIGGSDIGGGERKDGL